MDIRPFTLADYPALVAIHNSLDIVWPEQPRTPQAWAEADGKRSPGTQYRRWVAVEDGAALGFASYFHQGRMGYPPGSFYINVEVKPEYQRRGIGSALYEQIQKEVLAFKPPALRADAFTNLPQGFSFLQKRGFYEAFRETPVHLEVASFDASPFRGLEAKLNADGICIKTLPELQPDPRRDRKVYELYWKAWEDVPQESEHVDPPDFTAWLEWDLHDPSILSDAFFIAERGDEYIGLRELGTYSQSDVLMGGLLGVLRPYRNRGVGLALQLRGIAYARQHHYRLLKTCTAVQNTPMQALFDRLGYIRDPQWQQCQKDFE